MSCTLYRKSYGRSGEQNEYIYFPSKREAENYRFEVVNAMVRNMTGRIERKEEQDKVICNIWQTRENKLKEPEYPQLVVVYQISH